MSSPNPTWSGQHRLQIAEAIAAIVILTACGSTESTESSGPVSTAATAPSTTATTSSATTTVPPAAEIVVHVPTAQPPAIDGTISTTEWDGAVSVPMSDGADVLFMRDGEVLHVAVVGNEVGATNVIIATAEQVWILHSSAALGSAVYEAGASAWGLVHGFTWCCRNAADDSGPAELYDEEGWKANIGYAGDPGVVEYAIALRWQEAAVAISSIRDDADRSFWPADLSLEAQDQLLGVPPPDRHYRTDEWATLTSTG